MQPTPSPQHTTLTDRLPVIHGDGARLSRLCFDERFGGMLEAAGAPLGVGPLSEAADGPLFRVQFASDAGVLEFVVHAPDHPAVQMTAAPALDERMRRLAAHALLEPWLGHLDSWGITGAQALTVEPLEPRPALGRAGWCVVRDAAGRQTQLTITQWPDAAHHAVRQRLHAIAVRRRRHRHLALRGAVTLGVRDVALSTLRSLERGDVLIAPWLASPGGQAVTVRWGHGRGRRLEAIGRLNDTHLTIEGKPAMSDPHDLQEESPTDDPIDTLGELDIPVHFEIETVAVPLADLEAIEPGYVIELTTPVDAAVIRLTAYGQTIGHAQLVAVGDRLGARITRMVTRDEHQPNA
jgi:type III secretion protein Q